MAAGKIAVIGGDGIGPEVIDQAIRVVDAALKADGATYEWNRLPWSSAFYKKTGQIVPDDGWETLKKHDAVFLGAVGAPDVPDTVTVHGLLLPMRRKFDQFVNLRPAFLFDGVQSPLRDKARATSIPSRPGIAMSSRTRFGSRASAMRTALSPSCAVPTRWTPSIRASSICRRSAASGSSSAINILS